MIAVIEKEVVEKRKWLSSEDFFDCLALAQAMPGVLAVNIAVGVGRRVGGNRGGVAAALGAVLPSFAIILAIAMFFSPSMIKDNPVLASIFKGVRPCVVALIIAPVISAAKSARLTVLTFWIPVVVAIAIWSRLPVVSNPIIYIAGAIIAGCCIAYWRGRREGARS